MPLSSEISQSQQIEERRLRQMKFWEHVEEFRTRLLRIVIGVMIGTVGGMFFATDTLRWLLKPMADSISIAIHPTETIVVFFRVAFMLGLILAMPYIVYQVLAFFVPGMNRSERRILNSSIIFISLFFFAGASFAGGVMIPLAITYLRGFLAELVQHTYSIDSYVSFITTIMISSGLVFETPLVLALIARLGLVTSKTLASKRRVAMVVIAIVAGVITPTPDAFNMMIVMAPLWVLYEVGILLAWFAGRARSRALAEAGV